MNRVLLVGAATYVGLLVVAAGMVGVASAGSISFLDATFDDADWSLEILQENFISQQFTAAQEPTGGMPDEYRRNFMYGSETTNNGGIGPAGAAVGHFWISKAWDPSIQGMVDGVMYRSDAVAFDDRPFGQTVPTGVIVSMGFLLRQAGVVFVRNPIVGVTAPDSVWRQMTYNATAAASFTRFDQQPGHPDFSVSGGLIEFGYYTRAGAFVPEINNYFGVDNFQVTVATPGPIVPEPLAVALSVIGVMMSAVSRRRLVRDD